jgi:hypothetical protein
MSQEHVSKPQPPLSFSNFNEFYDALHSGSLAFGEDEMILTFTTETDFNFTSLNGQLIYQGNAADLRFLARFLFENAIHVSPFDNIDEREQEESEELEDLEC